ncbi:MAG: TetR/AcrR family transcriptional regulator [Oscillospiraceae bacterium]|jgi:AcrR family transcriptional regulator|nr:TetR/AcrR family transcriptional regulator [Oscillospiraceae bacterium]
MPRTPIELNYHILGQHYPLPLDSNAGVCKTRDAILLCATLLFAQKGYDGVSVGELARHIGIKPASLYNHFQSKEDLWKAVVLHTEQMYNLYFDLLNAELCQTENFAQALEIIFREPKLMENHFTCFAFNLILSEQLRDESAWEVMSGVFLEKSIRILVAGFDRCIQHGSVRPFHTRPIAILILNTVLNAVCMEAQRLMGRQTPYDPMTLMSDLQTALTQLLIGE